MLIQQLKTLFPQYVKPKYKKDLWELNQQLEDLLLMETINSNSGKPTLQAMLPIKNRQRLLMLLARTKEHSRVFIKVISLQLNISDELEPKMSSKYNIFNLPKSDMEQYPNRVLINSPSLLIGISRKLQRFLIMYVSRKSS